MTESKITPPPELKAKWMREDEGGPGVIGRMVDRAAQWGADQELEACCEWLESEPDPGHVDLLRSCATALRAARRPKPPSLKEQALEDLDQIDGYAVDQLSAYVIHGDLKRRVSNIRRALETLPND